MKHTFHLFFAVILISIPSFSYAILDGDFWIDMYKKIDEWMSKMESQNYEYELTGQWQSSIEQEVNRRLKEEGVSPCIWALTVQDIKKVKSWDIESLRKVLSEDCFSNDEGTMSNEQITGFIGAIWKVDNTVIENATDKTRHTYELSRIWLYSDGSKENSPFDLVDDIKEIEKIIFCEDSKYNGTPLKNTNERFSDLMRWVLRFIPKFNDDDDDITWTGTTWSGVYVTKKTREILTPIENSGSIISPYACSYEINTWSWSSWLSSQTIEELIYSSTGWTSSSSSSGGWVWSGKTSTGTASKPPKEFTPWAYKQANDNKEWECNQFFCIKIEFKMKNHKLLWWGKTQCIKSILEKTDKHLKKFAGTSLVQSKMTKNNFEIGLLNLSMPDVLHLWVQVYKKPAPILNLEKKDEDRNKDSEFKVKNLLYEKYKNVGLDYKRKNDLHEYKRKTEEYKSFMNCGELTNEECTQKVQDAYTQRVKAGFSQRKNSFTSRAITERANYQDSNDYFKEFTEIEKFWSSLRDFVFNSAWVIRKMNEIPENN
jgi:hypothetical protein